MHSKGAENQVSKDPFTLWREQRARQTAEHAESLRQRNAEHVKATARTAYINGGGTEGEFKTAWPQIRARLLSDEAVQSVKGSK